jgi:uncharacterized protein YjiS (DUF1127 family)
LDDSKKIVEIRPEIFAKFNLDTLHQITLLPIDVMRFSTTVFGHQSNLYRYTGGKRLSISEEDNQKLLNSHSTQYGELSLSDRKRHFERIHEKFTITVIDGKEVKNFPVITVLQGDEKKSIQPISHYEHIRYTSDIHYKIDPEFVEYNNRFDGGYRHVCLNALDALTSRYARFFFAYLSGDKYEFHFNESTLRRLLNLTDDNYKKRTALQALLGLVKEQLSDIGIDFDSSYCTEAEWKAYKQNKDNPDDQLPVAIPGKNKKNKAFTKNFWFRAKGMEKYRIPKGSESIFSRNISLNSQYLAVRTYFNRDLKMSDNYIGEKWEYIKRYVDEWGSQQLINLSAKKMKEMSKQKKRPRNPKSVLMSLIVNAVKDLDTAGRGQSTLFSPSAPASDYQRYDPRGKSLEQIQADIEARSKAPPDG